MRRSVMEFFLRFQSFRYSLPKSLSKKYSTGRPERKSFISITARVYKSRWTTKLRLTQIIFLYEKIKTSFRHLILITQNIYLFCDTIQVVHQFVLICDQVSVCCFFHDNVIKWKYFPRYWPFVRGIHRSPVNSPHKGQWRGALMFSLICVWINSQVNNREAGDLRRYRAHYYAILMFISLKLFLQLNYISISQHD